jgi:hypothetical protein
LLLLVQTSWQQQLMRWQRSTVPLLAAASLPASGQVCAALAALVCQAAAFHGTLAAATLPVFPFEVVL